MTRQIAKLKEKIQFELNHSLTISHFFKVLGGPSGNHYIAAILQRNDKLVISRVWRSTDSFGEHFNLDARQLEIFDKYDGWDKAFDYFWKLVNGDWFLEKGWKLVFEHDTAGEQGIILFRNPLSIKES